MSGAVNFKRMENNMEDFKTPLGGQYVSSFPTGSSVICDPPVLDTDRDFCVRVRDLCDAADLLSVAGWCVAYDDPEYKAHENSEIEFLTARKGKGVSTNLIIYSDILGYQTFLNATVLAKHLNLTEKTDRVFLFKTVLADRRVKTEVEDFE